MSNYNYIDKFKGQDGRLSVYDIASLDSNDAVLYEAVKIEQVKIDGNIFSSYGAYQFIWEKTFVRTPDRASDGSMRDIENHTTFLVPHLIMDFSIMSIDDYRAIMRMHYERNEFNVECYDPIYNKRIRAKMYFATEEMAKLYTINKVRLNEDKWEDWIQLVGVHDYTVELIGTNNDIELIKIAYHLNPPSNIGYTDTIVYDDDIYSGESVTIGEKAKSITSQKFNGQYSFKYWTTNKYGGSVYMNGKNYTINQGDSENALTLYAQWQPTTDTTISTYSLRSIEQESTSQEDKTYNFDYETLYTLDLYLDDVLFQRSQLKYDEVINFPILQKSGYTFDGWYYTKDFEYGTKFIGNMPSYNLQLYARWVYNI